jgi:hypothetical protein
MVDFNTVEDATFEALPRGMYPVVISDCEFTYSQNSGNPMWSMRLEVEEGDYAGRVLFNHLVFAGDGLAMTKRRLSRIAPELLERPFNPQDPEIINSIVGRRLRAKVTIRKYEGQNRNNVGDLFPADDAGGFTA